MAPGASSPRERKRGTHGSWPLWMAAALVLSCSFNSEETAPAAAGSSPSTPEMPANGALKADADVRFVKAKRDTDGTWTFLVTVAHPDQGWSDYTDGWDVVLPDGGVVRPDPASQFTRLLRHPHVDEQPFTRAQPGIQIPEGTRAVTVRAHDRVAGWGGAVVTVDLDQGAGPGFSVER